MSKIPMYGMPENQEEFQEMWGQVENDLGFNDMSMLRDRPYLGQPHTDKGIRGKTEIKGITFRDLHDCFIRAAMFSFLHGDETKELLKEAKKGEKAILCENDLYKFNWDDIDPMALCQNLSCEVERIMGIFPNVPGLKENLDDDDQRRNNS